MRMVKSLLLGSAAGIVGIAGAHAADLPVKAKPVEYVKICSLYGDGFYYIPGTDTCIQVGGNVQGDYGWNVTGARTAHYSGTAGAQDRTVSPYSTRHRADLAIDTRTQTAYGTLRTFDVIRIDNENQGTVTPNVPRAFIQWAGFTFGHTKSYSDHYGGFGGSDMRALLQGITHSETGGNGMVLVFGADERKNASIVNLSTANVFSVGVAPTTSRSGMNFPDPYATLR